MKESQWSFLWTLIAVSLFGTLILHAQDKRDPSFKDSSETASGPTVLVNGVWEPVYKVGKRVTLPRVVYAQDPEFSEEARQQRVEGTVVLGITVTSEGKATQIRVVRSLGYGLDEKAIEAVRNWKFRPGTKDGQPVSVMIAVEASSHLYHRN